MHAAARLVIAAPLLVGLAWAGGKAFNIARADALVHEAAIEMGTWAATRAQPGLGTWTAVNEKLLDARRILPSDPTAHELMGLLASQRGDSAKELDAAVGHLDRALALRPVSGYTWANRVEAQYRRGEPPRNMELGFERAAQLGGTEPGVQRIVADYGLALWEEVTPATQGVIDSVIAAGTRRNPLDMLQISERRGRLAPVCRHLLGASRTPDAKLAQLCSSREITP